MSVQITVFKLQTERAAAKQFVPLPISQTMSFGTTPMRTIIFLTALRTSPCDPPGVSRNSSLHVAYALSIRRDIFISISQTEERLQCLNTATVRDKPSSPYLILKTSVFASQSHSTGFVS